MGFVPMKFFVALQLSVLLLGPFTVSGQVDAEGFETLSKIHPPVAAPAPAPMYHLSPPPSHPHSPPPSSPPSYPHIPPPSHPHSPPPSSPPSHPHSPPPRPPPSHPPSPPPSHIPTPHRPPRSLVAVQGVVYCKSCKYSGVETLLGASPLSGAVVKLQCNNSKHPITQEAKTDKNGYFFIQAPKKVTSFGVHKCKVFLVSSPLYSCQKPTNLNWGLSGASLRYQKPPKPVPFSLYTVGPFAFGPKCPL